jgi:hypothetical protein
MLIKTFIFLGHAATLLIAYFFTLKINGGRVPRSHDLGLIACIELIDRFGST